MAQFKVGDTVVLPRRGDFNPKYSRDIAGRIKEVREGRLTSYLVGKSRYLENLLRPTNGNTITLLADNQE